MEVCKSVTTDTEIVAISKLVDVAVTQYKIENKQKFEEIHEELKKDRWEAAILVGKCVEHSKKYERIFKRPVDLMTEEQQRFVKDKFYEKYFGDMTEEKANILIELVDEMFNTKEYGGMESEDVSIS